MDDLPLDVVGRTVARVSAEKHMANYRAARALMGKRKEPRKEVRGEEGETKEVTLATASAAVLASRRIAEGLALL